MKKILKALVAWLDRKFPDRIVVTQKDYDILNARIKNMESEVAKLNVSLGFASMAANGPSLQTARGPFQR